MHLGRCLGSVLNNTYAPLEITCINDESTDDSLSIWEEYRAKDDRLKDY